MSTGSIWILTANLDNAAELRSPLQVSKVEDEVVIHRQYRLIG